MTFSMFFGSIAGVAAALLLFLILALVREPLTRRGQINAEQHRLKALNQCMEPSTNGQTRCNSNRAPVR